MKNKGLIIFCIVGWGYALYGAIKDHKSETTIIQLTENVEKNNALVKDSLPKLSETLAKANVAIHNQYKSDTTRRNTLPQTSIIGKMDTVERALLRQAKSDFAIERKGLKDSLNFFRSQYISTYASLRSEREKLKDIKVSQINPKFVKATDNADISFYEYPSQRKPGSLFSPVRNYLRITNNVDSGKVNGKPYFDYELANDQIYQLMFQMRSAYTLGSNRRSVGFGIELKLNNVSINGVINFQNKDKFAAKAFTAVDPSYRQNRFPVTFGVRYDFAKIVFR